MKDRQKLLLADFARKEGEILYETSIPTDPGTIILSCVEENGELDLGSGVKVRTQTVVFKSKGENPRIFGGYTYTELLDLDKGFSVLPRPRDGADDSPESRFPPFLRCFNDGTISLKTKEWETKCPKEYSDTPCDLVYTSHTSTPNITADESFRILYKNGVVNWSGSVPEKLTFYDMQARKVFEVSPSGRAAVAVPGLLPGRAYLYIAVDMHGGRHTDKVLAE